MSALRPPAPPAVVHRVAVIGAGYVGLPTAAVLSHFGHQVVCADNNPARYEMLRRGEVPIVEAGLEDLLKQGAARGTLRFELDAARAVAGARFVFLCVPTPQSPDGSADLSYVEAVAKEIAPHLPHGAIVVNKSTVPVGTVEVVQQACGRDDITVVSNPEFLREGTAVSDSLHPDRLVVGSDDPAAASAVGSLFAATGAPLIVTDTTTAETIKYASNAFLATKLSFVNAMASLCEAVGADVRDLVLGLGYDKRIGFEYLRPGPGWGGSCLPKDTMALVHIAEGAGYDFALLKAAMAANETQLQRVVDRVAQTVGGTLAGVTVGVLGLTFKAGTDDRRNSPALDVAARLVAAGARVRAFDPTVVPEEHPPADLADLQVCASAYQAAEGSSAVVVLTEWDEFRRIDFEKLRDVMATPRLVDARNLLDPAALRRIGFGYVGLGRP